MSHEQLNNPLTSLDLPSVYNEQLESRLLQHTTQWIPKPPPSYQHVRRNVLNKPVIIPRSAVHGLLSPPLPFMRAYSPVLKELDVHEQEFLAFIDHLAVVQTSPAPLQALNIVGNGISFVPWHWTLAVGLSMSAAAIAGSKMIISTRTKKYLEKVNRKYFAPRGLEVSLYKDEDLAAMLGHPQAWSDLAPVNAHLCCTSIRDRRLRALAPYVAPLSLDVPPPTPQRKLLDKISAKQIAYKLGKQEKKALKKQQKLRDGIVKTKDPVKQGRKDIKKLKRLEYIVVQRIVL